MNVLCENVTGSLDLKKSFCLDKEIYMANTDRSKF